MPLPTPEEVQDECGQIIHFTSKKDFENAGGNTVGPKTMRPSGRGDDYVVSAAPAMYNRPDVENAMEAIDAFWELFEDGGWTVFVWDSFKGEGWAYQHVGPDWVRYLYECMGRKSVPSAPPGDPNLLHKVNQYRRSLGHQKPLQPGEWSDQDLREFLAQVSDRFQNPVVRRLMSVRGRR